MNLVKKGFHFDWRAWRGMSWGEGEVLDLEGQSMGEVPGMGSLKESEKEGRIRK